MSQDDLRNIALRKETRVTGTNLPGGYPNNSWEGHIQLVSDAAYDPSNASAIFTLLAGSGSSPPKFAD
ncbi:MAG: hypothetical protein ACTS5I_02080, partial [Rhodanobacter sp.]